MIKRKSFYIAEFNEEAQWLASMHRDGWRMISTTGFKYEFEACEKEDWTYQLDFRDEAMNEEDYIQMYADYGWEFVTRFRHWYYFRKIRTADDDMSIFSDSESKIEMCRKVIAHHVMILAAYYIFILALFAFFMCGSSFAAPGSFLEGLFHGGASGLVLGGLVGIFFTGNQIHRLRRKISRLRNPLQ